MTEKKPTYKLSTVTPKRMKELDGIPGVTAAGNVLELVFDEANLRKLCETIFEDDFSEVDIMDVDLDRVGEGMQNFLNKWMQHFRTLPASTMTSPADQ